MVRGQAVTAGHVLVIEDELQIQRALIVALAARGYRTTVAARGQDGLIAAIRPTRSSSISTCRISPASRSSGIFGPGAKLGSSCCPAAPSSRTRCCPWTRAPTTSRPNPFDLPELAALVTRGDLEAAMAGPPHVPGSRYLRIHLMHLRRKLEADPARPRHLVTEHGLGFRFRP